MSPENDSNESLSSLIKRPKMGNFLLILFPNNILYVGKITGTPENEEFKIIFYGCDELMKAFSKPLILDEAIVLSSDLCTVLQTTVSAIKAKRLEGFVRFNYTFQKLDIR